MNSLGESCVDIIQSAHPLYPGGIVSKGMKLRYIKVPHLSPVTVQSLVFEHPLQLVKDSE